MSEEMRQGDDRHVCSIATSASLLKICELRERAGVRVSALLHSIDQSARCVIAGSASLTRVSHCNHVSSSLFSSCPPDSFWNAPSRLKLSKWSNAAAHLRLEKGAGVGG